MFVPIALAVVGALCLLNLLFVLGVVRRLREHGTAIAALGRSAGSDESVLPAGAEVGAFSATTTEGEPVSAEVLSGRTLVGFFAPGCEPCHLQLVCRSKIRLLHNDTTAAQQDLAEAASIAHETGDQYATATTLRQWGQLYEAIGEPHNARNCTDQASAILQNHRGVRHFLVEDFLGTSVLISSPDR